MEEDCGCDILPSEEKNKFILPDPNGVGEEIFKDEDIFDRVKKYYQEFTGEDDKIDEDDFLLRGSEKEKEKTDISSFTDELKDAITNKPEKVEINSRSLDALSNFNEFKSTFGLGGEGLGDIKKLDIQPIINSSDKERKIKFIKDYLKKLKDGS